MSVVAGVSVWVLVRTYLCVILRIVRMHMRIMGTVCVFMRIYVFLVGWLRGYQYGR
jgi:hypothetical protein